MTRIQSANFDFQRFHRLAGSLFFLVLLVYAIVYAVERTTYIDSAWLFFERVNGERFSFPGDRYSAFFSELPLFIAVKLHLPLRVLVYTFSISYILLYYIVWRICTYTLNNPVAGLAVIFGTFFGFRETFLHPVSETHQMVVYSALLFALLEYNFKRSMLKYSVVVLGTLLVMFTHPMATFTAGFALLFHVVKTKNIREVSSWLSAVVILSCCLLNYFHPANPYDAQQIGQLHEQGNNSFSLVASFPFQFIKMHLPHFYWVPVLAGLIAAIWLTLQREWLKLTLLLISVSVYFVIACIIFRNGDSSIMIERVFLPAFFMIGLAFADLLVNAKRMNKWIPMAMVVFFIVNGIHYLNTGCLIYKKRVAFLDQLVKDGIAQGSDKYFLSDARTDMDKISVPWALGTETLIYSKFKYDRCISISMKNEICTPESCRLTSMLCLPVADLNAHYFQLSANPYRELSGTNH